MAEPIAVVSVIDGPGESLTRFLASLDAATRLPLDIVLADSGRADAAVTRAASRTDVRVVAAGRELGYAHAVNQSVHATTAEFVIVADPDIEWEPGSLDALLAAAARWPRAAAFGPLIRTPEGAAYSSARALPSLSRGIGHAMFGWWWPSNPWTSAYHAEQDAPVERTAGWLSVSCLLLRRDAFDEIGGFDDQYVMYFEDLDLGARFGRAGWQNVYVPSAVVRDVGGHATTRDASRMAAEHHRSAWRYVSRRYAGWRWFPVRLALRVGLGTRSLMARRSRRVAQGAPLPRVRS
jgi:N-acetylglucosaminyl-diphospho-decaprenol L-rhamnosyltransferase